jgi:MFS family permease
MSAIAGVPARNIGLVLLLGLAVLLTYVDRGAIGIAAPLMKDELQLSATGFGLAVSAFFWVYAPLCVLTGWLCDRFCPYRLFAVGLFLWAISTVLTGFVGGLTMLVIYRLMLGLGESIVFPGASKIIAARVPLAQRGLANAVVATGTGFGTALGTLAGGLILSFYGWRAVFLVFGLITLVWLLPWNSVTRPLRSAKLTAPVIEPFPLARLIAMPALWAMGVGHFLVNYGFYFLISWLPLYLVKVRGYSIIEMTELTTVIYLAQGCMALLSGWVSDHMVRSGTDEGRLRKGLLAFQQVSVAIGIAGIFLSNSTSALVFWLLLAGTMGAVGGATNLFALAQMFSGPRAAGSWAGVQNAIGNAAGIVGPIITGLIIDRLGGYGWAFASASALSLCGAVWWLVGVPKVRLVDIGQG